MSLRPYVYKVLFSLFLPVVIVPSVGASTVFRGMSHEGVNATLSIHGTSPTDTLVAISVGSSTGVRTLTGPSAGWDVIFAPLNLPVGHSIDVHANMIFAGGDPDIKMLTAARESNEKQRLIAQGVVKARREKGSDP